MFNVSNCKGDQFDSPLCQKKIFKVVGQVVGQVVGGRWWWVRFFLLFWTDRRINIIPVRNLRVRQFGPIRSIRSSGDPHLTMIVDLTTIVL